MPLHFILFGPPGSGKGTQAQLLADKYHIKHISTGEMFRKEITEKTDLGQALQASIDKGILASDDVANKIVAKILKILQSEKKGFILDGYPRTKSQAQFLADMGVHIDHVILLDISDEEAIERLQNRYKTATLTYKRADDASEDAMRKRLNYYHDHTKQLINFYEDAGLLRHINGSLNIEKVAQSILSIIEDK